MGRVVWAAVVTALGAAVFSAPAAAELRTVSKDGDAFAFSTKKSLDPADTDSAYDAYVWAKGAVRLVSGGASEPAYARAISADGEVVLFQTAGSLLPEDGDGGLEDVYADREGALDLVTTGSADPGTGGGWLEDMSADGSRIFFTTTTPLVAADTDEDEDVYVRSGGATTLVTPSARSGFRHSFGGASADGSRVFEFTDEPLVDQDLDGGTDLYERSGGAARLVSTGTLGSGLEPHELWRGGPSADGTSYVFSTDAKLEPGDLNDTLDLYQRRNGRTYLLTANAQGLTQPCPSSGGSGGPPPCTPWFDGQSADGARVVFSAGQRLTAEDDNVFYDLYRRSGTAIRHLGPSGNVRVSADALRIVLGTGQQLAPGDTDSEADLYELHGGRATLLTPGSAGQTNLEAISADGEHAFFDTREGLVPEDVDNRTDIYEAAGGRIRLVTTGPSDDHADDRASEHHVVTPAPEGTRVFFTSQNQLVPEDTDALEDVYMWSGGQTTLVSG